MSYFSDLQGLGAEVRQSEFIQVKDAAGSTRSSTAKPLAARFLQRPKPHCGHDLGRY